ncbi:MAG: hypothetical protein RIS97_210 [Pseudomonadota bacterium]
MSFGLDVRNGAGLGLGSIPSLKNAPAYAPLNLKFTDTTTLDSSVTFTRSTTATYVDSTGLVKTAAINAPRFNYDPVTLASKGLLIEEPRTNLALYSDQINNVVWIKAGGTVTTDATTAPDGTVSAELLVEDTSTGGHSVTQSIAGLPDSTVYTVSAYVKPNSRSWIAVSFADKANVNNRVWYNITTGTQGTTNGTVTAFSAVAAGNGWYRISVSASTGTGVSVPALRFSLGSADNTASYTGNGTSGAFIWGTQVELGAFSTSYIPTTSLSVARTADNASITGSAFSSWFNATSGTMFAQFQYNSLNSATPGRIFTITDGTTNNYLNLYQESTTSFAGSIQVAGVSQALLPAITPPNTSINKIALSYVANSFAAAGNGGTVVTDTSGTIPTVDRAVIGAREDGSAAYLNGHILQLAYYPRVLTPAALQSITI